MLTVVFVLYGLRLVVVQEALVVFEATFAVFVDSAATVVIADFVGMAMVVVFVVKIGLLEVTLYETSDPFTEIAIVDHLEMVMILLIKVMNNVIKAMINVIKTMIDVVKALVLDDKMIPVVARLFAPFPPLSPLRRSFRIIVRQVVRPVVPGMVRLKVSVRAVVLIFPAPLEEVAVDLLVNYDDVLVAHVDVDEGQLLDYDAAPHVELAVEEVIRRWAALLRDIQSCRNFFSSRRLQLLEFKHVERC